MEDSREGSEVYKQVLCVEVDLGKSQPRTLLIMSVGFLTLAVFCCGDLVGQLNKVQDILVGCKIKMKRI